MSADTAEVVSKALRRAWQLGQTYWQQADSDSFKQQDKSALTQAKFLELAAETNLAVLAQAATVDAAVAAAVERCAALCEQQRIGIDGFGGIDYHVELTRDVCAAAIRATLPPARKEKT